MKDWIYDEFNQVGVDYSQKEIAGVYDEQMESFRNYAEEAKVLIGKLGLESAENLTAVDLGCGTGAFAVNITQYFRKVYAIDVSKEMLNIAKGKAEEARIGNIEFVNSGFLQFKLKETVDVIISKWAFHHLPDYWKQAALLNMNRMLKEGGKLYLSDVVFRFDQNYEKNIDGLLDKLSKEYAKAFVEETKVHIREEYSTFDWILQGMCERAGFEIEYENKDNILEMEFVCRKIMEV